MMKKTCKIRKQLSIDFVCCKCADWLCFYDETCNVVRMCNTSSPEFELMPF